MGCGHGVWPWGVAVGVGVGEAHRRAPWRRARPPPRRSPPPSAASARLGCCGPGAAPPGCPSGRRAPGHARGPRGHTPLSPSHLAHTSPLTPRRSHLAAHTTLDLPQPGAAAPEQSSRAVPPCRCRGGSAAPQPPPRYRRRPAGAAAARGSRGSTCAPARVAGHRVRARPPPRGAGPRGAGSVAPVPPPMPSRSSAHSPAAASCYLPPAAACDRPAPRRRPPR